MKIAIIGAGFTGLTAALRLSQQNHEVTVFEKDARQGGLAIGYKENGWSWTLEAFYHHWFTNDKSILKLARELEFPVIIKRPKTNSYIDGDIYQLDSPLTLLNFKKLSLWERLQMGSVLGFLKLNPFWKPLEKITASKFLSKTIGKRAYKILWEPLLIGKFGKYASEVSLSWFWARIYKRTTSLAYPEGGFLKFADRLAEEVRKNGGKVLYNTEISELTSADKPQIKYKTMENDKWKMENYDAVVVTLPSFAFLKLAPTLPEEYQKSLMTLKGLGAVMLILRLKEKFFKDNTYWLNVCDPKAPVLAIVEHTNFMESKNYNNEHIVYLGHYLSKEHPYFQMNEKELLKTFDPFLKKINPEYKKGIIAARKFSVPFAQPIIPVNYSKKVPPLTTPLKNVYLANMQQVYPWDRGTNYAVELGEKVTNIISGS